MIRMGKARSAAESTPMNVADRQRWPIPPESEELSGPNDTRNPQTSSRPTCRTRNVSDARKPRPPCRTFCCHVSRQVLVEPGPHRSRSLLVDGRPTLAWVHGALIPRLEIHSGHSWNGRLCLWRASLHPRGMGRTCRPQTRHDDSDQPGDRSRVRNVPRRNLRSVRD
jgi:hypothetical protein